MKLTVSKTTHRRRSWLKLNSLLIASKPTSTTSILRRKPSPTTSCPEHVTFRHHVVRRMKYPILIPYSVVECRKLLKTFVPLIKKKPFLSIIASFEKKLNSNNHFDENNLFKFSESATFSFSFQFNARHMEKAVWIFSHLYLRSFSSTYPTLAIVVVDILSDKEPFSPYPFAPNKG